MNLSSPKWLRSARSLVISLFPLWFSQLKTLLDYWGLTWVVFILFFKTRNKWCGKKLNFWKNNVLFWKRMFFNILKELIWKDTKEIHFCKISKSSITSCTSGCVEGTPDLVHCKAFLLMYFLLFLRFLGICPNRQILFYGENINYNLAQACEFVSLQGWIISLFSLHQQNESISSLVMKVAVIAFSF